MLAFSAMGCAPRADKAVPWSFDDNQYVFIEYRQEEDGRVIEGEPPPPMIIDFPTYMFDPNSGTLASKEFTFDVDDTLRIVLGKSTALRGAAGGGMASRLVGIYTLPYSGDDIVIRGVDRDVNAHIDYRNERLAVESGDEWQHVETRRDTLGTARDRAIIEYTTTVRIINYGVLDKSKIRRW